jgi:CRP-like cAMP-binding protein
MSLHIFTCFWFFIAKFEDFGPDTWVTRKDLQDVSTVKSYFFSLYWALVTLSTTGYGDISAKTRGELLVSIFWMIIALYFLSFSISSLSTMISEKDSGKNRQIDSKLSMVDAYASENNLPKKVKIKMQKMVKETSEKLFYQFNTKEKMMREMPAKIRMNIASSAHFGALSLFAILRDREEKFLYTIVPLLKTENVKAGTILFAAGNPCRDIYFMIHGKGYFVDREGVRFKVISPGSYFGDIEVVQNVKRIFDVVISEYSVLWVLTPDVFKIIQQEFIIFFKELKRDTAKRFDLLLVELSEMKALQKANLEMVRDVGNVRILIDLEYKKICQEFKLEQSEKNSISRIDRKLDLCKKLFLSNQNLLKRIQVDLRDLVRLTDEQDLKLN